MKKTNFGHIRFIIPKDWFEKIISDSKEKLIFRNAVFLNTKRNQLKSNININQIMLVVYEIMNYIISSFEVDYIIEVKYDYIKKIVDIESVEIFSNENFHLFNPNFERFPIERSYLKYPEFSIINSNTASLSDSTNKLLKEPKEFFNLEKNNEKEKNDSTSIKRINTDGNYSSNQNNIMEENDLNQANKDDNKLVFNKNIISNNNEKNKKIENNNKENEDNEDDLELGTDEFNNDEKFHGISQKHYRHLSLKNFNGDIKEVLKEKEFTENQDKDNINKEKENKKEEEKEEVDYSKKEELKKYFFNDSQFTINLSTFEGESLKPVGLYNPSIYCFMICILQALLSIPELNYFFLSRFYSKNFAKNENEEENETIICDIFHNFIQAYMFGKRFIEIPKKLRMVSIRLLGGMRMHDCQEFFVCFLEALQDELNNKEKMNVPENASMELRWTAYRKINNSFIDSIFTGLMRSTVQCRKCNYKSYTFDPFIDLSVSINKSKNLEKCLKQYFENEKMDCEYKCDKCKEVSKVSKIIL